MTRSQLMTGGAIAFAGFALWYIARRPAAGAPVTRIEQEGAQLAALMRRMQNQQAEFAAPITFTRLFDGATLGS